MPDPLYKMQDERALAVALFTAINWPNSTHNRQVVPIKTESRSCMGLVPRIHWPLVACR